MTGRRPPRNGPIIDLERRNRDEPVTPVDVEVVSVERPPYESTGHDIDCGVYATDDPRVPGDCTCQPVDPKTVTGSLPVLQEARAAIEGRTHVTIERTTAEQRRADLDEELHTIADWWRALTEEDIKATLPKALEYGASDLDLMGQGVRMLQGDVWEGGDAGERRAVGQELAVLFYLQGKIARALSAAGSGQRCSDDTIKDIRIYAVMLQKVRETGSWVN